MIKIKDDVNILGLRTELILAVLAAQSFCSSINKDCVITSCVDSMHSFTSLHYAGCALDFRTRDMNNTEQKMFYASMKEALGMQFDVILESNHLHVEFQPKYNEKFYQ